METVCILNKILTSIFKPFNIFFKVLDKNVRIIQKERT